jgi:hypothetical protein
MDTKISLITFQTEVDPPVFWNQDPDFLKPLEYKKYNPEGGTALYDAVGATIDKLRELPEIQDPHCSFLVVIISDGEENSSKYYNSKLLSKKIIELQKTEKWTFTYLGSNQDLSKVSESLGIHVGNTQMWAASAAGMDSMSTENACATEAFLGARSMGVTSSTNFYSGANVNQNINPTVGTTLNPDPKDAKVNNGTTTKNSGNN